MGLRWNACSAIKGRGRNRGICILEARDLQVRVRVEADAWGWALVLRDFAWIKVRGCSL